MSFLKNKWASRPVFVIGTGRSGTHWIGFSLGDHPEVRATIEIRPMFRLSTRMALNPNLERWLFPRLVLAYNWQLFKSGPKLYLDKSHPNIWIADKLKKVFPNAKFIGIERNPYATVASMLKHDGVLAWHKKWKKYPVPNRFLGITTEMEETYDSIPLASKCAMRWQAHHDKMRLLKNSLGDDLLVISYETFAKETDKTIIDLKQFLELNQPIPVPKVKAESLDKWKYNLLDEQINQIQDIVGVPPELFT